VSLVSFESNKVAWNGFPTETAINVIAFKPSAVFLSEKAFLMALQSDRKLKIGFIGAGIVGTALAVRLSRRGYDIAAVSSRSPQSLDRFARSVKNVKIYLSNQEVADNADIVFITTPDDVIPLVAAQVKWRPGQSAVHCSGADSSAILEQAKKLGAFTGCFHPLQTFAGVEKAVENIPGSTFALEAAGPLLNILKEMVAALEGNWVIVPAEDKPAYHAAAVIASNYLVTLTKMSTDLWRTFGIPQDRAVKALLPLLHGTLNNIAAIGLPNCLTGPIARGDTGTVQKHLDTLERLTPHLVSTYRELGLQTVPIALAKGRINEARAEDMKNILKSSVITE
jgi:predicted short-subunit dehydrogenase-like oxidoreductase (DUF2520 family)